MKDFLGNELSIGDTVVAAVGHGRNSGASLVKFTITGFTKCFIKGYIPNYTEYISLTECKISPDKVIKINTDQLP